MALCNEMVPEDLTFYQERMRGHLQCCLKNMLMQHFPSKHRNIFCKCRRQENGEMTECAKCKEWYHKTCITVPDSAWSDAKLEWCCDNCSP